MDLDDLLPKQKEADILFYTLSIKMLRFGIQNIKSRFQHNCDSILQNDRCLGIHIFLWTVSNLLWIRYASGATSWIFFLANANFLLTG